jgi:hypothetical protein
MTVKPYHRQSLMAADAAIFSTDSDIIITARLVK